MTHLRKDVFPRIAEHICMIGLHVANCPSAFEAPSTDRVPFAAYWKIVSNLVLPGGGVDAATAQFGLDEPTINQKHVVRELRAMQRVVQVYARRRRAELKTLDAVASAVNALLAFFNAESIPDETP